MTYKAAPPKRDPRIDPMPDDILLRRIKDTAPSAITVTARLFEQFGSDRVSWIGPVGADRTTLDLWRGMVADAEVIYVSEVYE